MIKKIPCIVILFLLFISLGYCDSFRVHQMNIDNFFGVNYNINYPIELDVDGDGDTDIICIDKDGIVYLLENITNEKGVR